MSDSRNLSEHLISTEELKTFLMSVADFHDLFGHPDRIGKDGSPGRTKPMHIERRRKRAKWIHDEIVEYIMEDNATRQAKELADIIYFAVGNLVEIGWAVTPGKPLPMGEFMSSMDNGDVLVPSARPDDIRSNDRALLSLALWQDLAWFLTTSSAGLQVYHSIRIVGICYLWLGLVHAVDVAEAFRIVHDSNMTKVWPDGSIRYNDYGKIMKPTSFVQPYPEMELLVNAGLKAWYDSGDTNEDDIPF